jgi:crotonobetainyl-CoA:carnitine CoA-transferase CaiB-like acyl-CoA transferase
MASGKGMFEGVRVVELAQYVFAPGAGVLLADQGAEVIKVELTGKGDPYRSLKIGDGRETKSGNLAMEQNNRGKKSLALDLKSETGRNALLALIATADVFLTSLRPKALSSLRLDVDDVRAANPRIIYARGNALGFQGNQINKPGFDGSAFWARGGAAYTMSPPGQPLTPSRPAMGDHLGSMNLAFGIASALFRRSMTGEPAVIETSLLSTAIWMLSSDITYSQVDEYVVHRSNAAKLPLIGAYPTRDGRLVQLMLLDPQPFWPTLCKMLGKPEMADDPRFVDNPARLANAADLTTALRELFAARDWAEWQPIFDPWDAPWELVRNIHEVAADPEAIANHMYIDIPMPDGNKIRAVTGPVLFDGTPMAIAPHRAPELGEHTDELLRSAGYSDEQVTELKAAGAAQ